MEEENEDNLVLEQERFGETRNRWLVVKNKWGNQRDEESPGVRGDKRGGREVAKAKEKAFNGL